MSISVKGIRVRGLCRQLTDKTSFLKEEITISCDFKCGDNITDVRPKW